VEVLQTALQSFLRILGQSRKFQQPRQIYRFDEKADIRKYNRCVHPFDYLEHSRLGDELMGRPNAYHVHREHNPLVLDDWRWTLRAVESARNIALILGKERTEVKGNGASRCIWCLWW